MKSASEKMELFVKDATCNFVSCCCICDYVRVAEPTCFEGLEKTVCLKTFLNHLHQKFCNNIF